MTYNSIFGSDDDSLSAISIQKRPVKKLSRKKSPKKQCLTGDDDFYPAQVILFYLYVFIIIII